MWIGPPLAGNPRLFTQAAGSSILSNQDRGRRRMGKSHGLGHLHGHRVRSRRFHPPEQRQSTEADREQMVRGSTRARSPSDLSLKTQRWIALGAERSRGTLSPCVRSR